MSGRSKKKLVVGVGAALAVIGGGAVAYAEWSGTATGTGRARALTTVQATISPSDGAPDLYPGFTDGDVSFTITNPNPFAITYTDMTPGTVTSSDETACPASNVTVDSAGSLSLASPPGASQVLSIADVVNMAADAPDGCQGVSFGIALTLTGVQTAPS